LNQITELKFSLKHTSAKKSVILLSLPFSQNFGLSPKFLLNEKTEQKSKSTSTKV